MQPVRWDSGLYSSDDSEDEFVVTPGDELAPPTFATPFSPFSLGNFDDSPKFGQQPPCSLPVALSPETPASTLTPTNGSFVPAADHYAFQQRNHQQFGIGNAFQQDGRYKQEQQQQQQQQNRNQSNRYGAPGEPLPRDNFTFRPSHELERLASLTSGPGSAARGPYASTVDDKSSSLIVPPRSFQFAKRVPPLEPTPSRRVSAPSPWESRISMSSLAELSGLTSLTTDEIELIARLHGGRIPTVEQVAPPELPATATRIINTGNTGPMRPQAGDWNCGCCSFLNWRRRKVCMRCFPFANDIGAILSARNQCAAQLAGARGKQRQQRPMLTPVGLPGLSPSASRSNSESSVGSIASDAVQGGSNFVPLPRSSRSHMPSSGGSLERRFSQQMLEHRSLDGYFGTPALLPSPAAHASPATPGMSGFLSHTLDSEHPSYFYFQQQLELHHQKQQQQQILQELLSQQRPGSPPLPGSTTSTLYTPTPIGTTTRPKEIPSDPWRTTAPRDDRPRSLAFYPTLS